MSATSSAIHLRFPISSSLIYVEPEETRRMDSFLPKEVLNLVFDYLPSTCLNELAIRPSTKHWVEKRFIRDGSVFSNMLSILFQELRAMLTPVITFEVVNSNQRIILSLLGNPALSQEEALEFFNDIIEKSYLILGQRELMIDAIHEWVTIFPAEKGIKIFKLLNERIACNWICLTAKIKFLIDWSAKFKDTGADEDKNIINKELVLNYAIETYLKELGEIEPDILFFNCLLNKKRSINATWVCGLIDKHINPKHAMQMKINVLTSTCYLNDQNTTNVQTNRERFVCEEDVLILLIGLIQTLIKKFDSESINEIDRLNLFSLLNKIASMDPIWASTLIPTILKIKVIADLLKMDSLVKFSIGNLGGLLKALLVTLEGLLSMNAMAQAKQVIDETSLHFRVPNGYLCAYALALNDLDEALKLFDGILKDRKTVCHHISLGLDLVDALIIKGQVERATALLVKLYSNSVSHPWELQIARGAHNQGIPSHALGAVLDKWMKIDPAAAWEKVVKHQETFKNESNLVSLFLSYADLLKSKGEMEKAKQAFLLAFKKEKLLNNRSLKILENKGEVNSEWIKAYVRIYPNDGEILAFEWATYKPKLALEIYHCVKSVKGPFCKIQPLLLIAEAFRKLENKEQAEFVWEYLRGLRLYADHYIHVIANLDKSRVPASILKGICIELEKIVEINSDENFNPFQMIQLYKELLFMEAYDRNNGQHLIELVRSLRGRKEHLLYELKRKENSKLDLTPNLYKEWKVQLESSEFNEIELLKRLIRIKCRLPEKEPMKMMAPQENASQPELDQALWMIEQQQDPEVIVDCLSEVLNHYYSLTPNERLTLGLDINAFEAKAKNLLVKCVKSEQSSITQTSSAVVSLQREQPWLRELSNPSILMHLIRLGADDCLEVAKQKFQTYLNKSRDLSVCNLLLTFIEKMSLNEDGETRGKLVEIVKTILSMVDAKIYEMSNGEFDDVEKFKRVHKRLISVALRFDPLFVIPILTKFIDQAPNLLSKFEKIAETVKKASQCWVMNFENPSK